MPKSPSRTASTACRPKRVASQRSKALGVPPRWTWPRTVVRASWPVRLYLGGEPFADPREPGVAEGVARTVLEHRVAVLGHRPLGDDHDRRVRGAEARGDPGADLIDVEALLGDEDDVGAAGQPRVQRDPPRVPAHHLDDQDTHVRLGGGTEAVDGLGGDIDRRVEPEGVVGGREVVVDGLRYADTGDPVLAPEAVGHPQRVLAADHDERVDPMSGEALPHPSDAVLGPERIGARRSEYGAAARQDSAYFRDAERDGAVLQWPAPAVLESGEAEAVLLDALADGSPDDRVEPGAVPAPGQHSDPHGTTSLRSGRRRTVHATVTQVTKG